MKTSSAIDGFCWLNISVILIVELQKAQWLAWCDVKVKFELWKAREAGTNSHDLLPTHVNFVSHEISCERPKMCLLEKCDKPCYCYVLRALLHSVPRGYNLAHRDCRGWYTALCESLHDGTSSYLPNQAMMFPVSLASSGYT